MERCSSGGRERRLSAIPISHVCDSPYSTSYNIWKVNDLHLDWGQEDKTQAVYKDPNQYVSPIMQRAPLPGGRLAILVASLPLRKQFRRRILDSRADMDCKDLPSVAGSR
ncbi:PREDICTED: uncharacterized protein LOC106813977 [Priapulus caudatus]|uniref:Uncharacterized protein LOC106813977 n=1 Tax=Priapulus caudatus TaxID=37621 RepID=A0ABM1ENE8_PRICU|nr:PREDICTED: uncharacterized protein LOC106813977 [Priapulus caudatus]